MGDAQMDSEKEILAKGYTPKSDVLKVGHHGSSSSTSPDFLKAVSPQYAIISCGLNNDYGHPHQVTLDKLNAAGVKIYRTDLNGTISLQSDGSNITISTEK
jgi:competence protein ComEC